jgi:peptidoglycan/xylan/chitin deacetylase (PgdA/CDA1 family)
VIRGLARRTKGKTARVWRRLESLGNLAPPGGVSLIYHRIAQPLADPWNMSVSPERFAMHMEILRRFAVPCTFGEFADRLSAKIPEPSISVTFDDGYADNRLALPILEAHDVPATIFVISGSVGNPSAFWWELLTQIFLETPTLPRQLMLTVDGKPRQYDLGPAAVYGPADLARSAAWRGDDSLPEDSRQRTYLDVWAHLVGLPSEDITDAARELRTWAGLPETEPTDGRPRPVTRVELQRLADSPLIEIGGHTRTHADLSVLSRAQAATEIADGRRDLIEMTGRDVRSFAYPYGRFGPDSIADIRDAGFACAGNSRPGRATPRNDPLALPRIHATDLSSEHFEALLATFIAPRRNRAARS